MHMSICTYINVHIQKRHKRIDTWVLCICIYVCVGICKYTCIQVHIYTYICFIEGLRVLETWHKQRAFQAGCSQSFGTTTVDALRKSTALADSFTPLVQVPDQNGDYLPTAVQGTKLKASTQNHH